MNSSEERQVHSLSEWLEAATKGLATPAKERIRVEIEAHYAQAVAAHVGEGLSESDAQAAALTDLGDPKTAARRLRKEHLTETEAALADRMLRYERSGAVLGFACLAFVWIYRDWRDHGVWILGFIGFVLFPAMCFVIARRRVVRMSVLILTESLGGLVIIAAGYAEGLWPISSSSTWVAMLVMGYACFVRPLRVWYKLRRAKDDWQEMPPRKTASS